MTIQQWLESGKDYQTGLLLYAKQKRHNKRLLQLFLKKENSANINKLNYELKKLQQQETQTVKVNVAPIANAIPTKPTKTPDKQYRVLKLNQLPVELHDLYIAQKTNFQKACSLKIKLNALAPEQETEALDLCLDIERLFDSIEKTWQVFDHYLKFKTIPQTNTTKSYTNLTAAQLLKAEQSKREAISKAKSRIRVYNANLDKTTDRQKRDKITRQLQKKNEDLLSHQIALEQIKTLIHKKEQ